MAKRRVPRTVTEQQRQFLDAFVQLLKRDEKARVSWLCALRAATRGTPYNIQLPPADRPHVETQESLHPTTEAGSYVFSLLTGLRLDPPDFWVPVNDLDLQIWLRDTVAAYRAGRYTDPFQPWEPRGRPRRNLQEIVQTVIRLMQACYTQGREPSQPYVRLLYDKNPDAPDFEDTTRYLRKHGYTWSRLKAMAWASQEKN